MKTYMKVYRKEVVIILLQAFVFYIFPLFAGPTDMMGLVFLILLATFVLGMIVGVSSAVPVKYLYPLLVSVMFVPTVLIYYNETAMIHAMWYFVVSAVGLVIGLLIRVIVKWMDGREQSAVLKEEKFQSRTDQSVRTQNAKRALKVFGVIVAVAACSCVLWFFGFHNVKRLDNIPSLELIGIEGEAFGHKKLQGYQREQLIEIWGEPTEVVHSNEDFWRVDEDTMVRINYNNLGEVVAVGVIEL